MPPVQLQKYSLSHRVFISMLREYRQQRGLTQGQLAEKLGVIQPFVCKYEVGERRLDTVEWIAICDVLEIKPEDFLSAFRERLHQRGQTGETKQNIPE